MPPCPAAVASGLAFLPCAYLSDLFSQGGQCEVLDRKSSDICLGTRVVSRNLGRLAAIAVSPLWATLAPLVPQNTGPLHVVQGVSCASLFPTATAPLHLLTEPAGSLPSLQGRLFLQLTHALTMKVPSQWSQGDKTTTSPTSACLLSQAQHLESLSDKTERTPTSWSLHSVDGRW
jgi:hypothetical protein